MKKSKTSYLPKILIIGIVALCLLVPLALIGSLVDERANRHLETSHELLGKWGGPIALRGPVLIVPYQLKRYNKKGGVFYSQNEAVILPKSLVVTGQVDVQTRSRGIYERNTFATNLGISGYFDKGRIEFPADTSKIYWDRAWISIKIPSPREVVGEPSLRIQDKDYAFDVAWQQNYHLEAKLKGFQPRKRMEFQFDLPLRGADTLTFEPFAESMSVNLQSNWSDPSFFGSTLPTGRRISEHGFDVEWIESAHDFSSIETFMPNIASYQYGHTSSPSAFGVKFYDSVNHYHKTERTLKYGILFVFLTFASFFLFEVLSGLRLHPIQYALVGCALVLFYLLLLSITEHVAFWIAYGAGASAVVLLIGGYCRSILKASSRSALVSSGLATLYMYLYFLLILEHYSLLFGSFGLFGVLAIMMYLTRNIDWYRDQEGLASKEVPSAT